MNAALLIQAMPCQIVEIYSTALASDTEARGMMRQGVSIAMMVREDEESYTCHPLLLSEA